MAKKEDLEATDDGQNTPIIWAARQNPISSSLIININVSRYSMNHMLEVLITFGANVNYQGASESLGNRGIRNSTALHWAVRYPFISVWSTHCPKEERFKFRIAFLNRANDFFLTSFIAQVINRNKEAIRMLLEAGANSSLR